MRNIVLFAGDIYEINNQQAKNFKTYWHDKKNDVRYYSKFESNNEEEIKNQVKMHKDRLKVFHDRILDLYKNFNMNYKKDAWKISNDLSCDYYDENKDGFIIERLTETNLQDPKQYLRKNGLFLWKVINSDIPFTHIIDLTRAGQITQAAASGEGFDVRRTFQNYAVLEAQSNCRNRCLYRKESKR